MPPIHSGIASDSTPSISGTSGSRSNTRVRNHRPRPPIGTGTPVTEHGVSMDDHTMKFGLLMESAQAHQKLAEAHLEKLRAHTQELDDVVREEIRRTLIADLQALTTETDRAAAALRKMQQAAHLRGVAWNIGFAVLCTAVPA